MPNTDNIINEVISSQAFKDVTQFTTDLATMTTQFVAAAAAADAANKSISNVKGLKDLQVATQNVNAENATMTKLYTELETIQQKRVASQTELAKQIATQKVLLQQQNAEITREAKENLAAVGSVEQKRLALQRLQKQYDLLTASQRNASDGQSLLKNIQALDAEVKKLQASTGRFGLSVGNYNSVWDGFKEKGISALNGIDNGFKNLGRTILTTAASYVGITGIFEFFKSSIEKFENVEVAAKRFENAIKNLGGSEKDVAVLTKSVEDLTTKFGYLSKVDVTQAQTKLVTFGKLSADQIKQLMPLIVDFAANARIGIGEATETVIKALEGQARGLKVYGINVKDAKTEAERFTLIQDELSKRVAGSAQIFADSGEGKIATYEKRLNSLKATIGEQLMPVYVSFLNGSLNIIDVLKKIDFSNLLKGIALLTGAWALYKIEVGITTFFTETLIGTKLRLAAAWAFETAAIAIENAQLLISNAIKGVATTLTNIYTVATINSATATGLAAVAYRVLAATIALITSPLGITLGLIIGLTTAFGIFSAKANESSVAIKRSAEAQRQYEAQQRVSAELADRVTKSTEDQIAKLIMLTKITSDTAISDSTRRDALNQLIAISPAYQTALKNESINIAEVKKQTDLLIESIKEQSRVEALHQLTLAKEAKVQELETSIGNQETIDYAKDGKTVIGKHVTNKDNTVLGAVKSLFVDNETTKYENDKKDLEKIKADLEVLYDKYAQAKTKIAGEKDPDKGKGLKNGLSTTNSGADKKEETLAEQLAKFNAKLRDDELKAIAQQNEEKIKMLGDGFKQITENEKNSLNDRLNANTAYYLLQENLIKQKSQLEENDLIRKTIREKESILKRPLNDNEKLQLQNQISQQLKNIEQKTQDDITKIQEEGLKKQQDIRIKYITQQLAERQKISALRISELNSAEDIELTWLAGKYNRGLITTEEYEKQKLDIENRYAIQRLKIQLDEAENALRVAKGDDAIKALENVLNIKKQLADAEVKINEDKNKKITDSDKKQHDQAVAQQKQLKQDLPKQLEAALVSFIDASFEREKNNLAKQGILIDQRYKKELNYINNLNLTDAQRADKIKILDANTAAQKNELAQKQKEQDIKKAKFDKLKSIFDIGVNIATQEVAALTYLSNPLTAPLYPGIAALIGVIGALQLAAVIAQPIPQYYTGTEDSKGGLVWLGERGKELLKTPDGSVYETPGKPTLAAIPSTVK